jgi:hypothetical protein
VSRISNSTQSSSLSDFDDKIRKFHIQYGEVPTNVPRRIPPDSHIVVSGLEMAPGACAHVFPISTHKPTLADNDFHLSTRRLLFGAQLLPISVVLPWSGGSPKLPKIRLPLLSTTTELLFRLLVLVLEIVSDAIWHTFGCI